MKGKHKPVLAPAVRRFLAAPRIARFATVGPDGYPHVVPLYFMREGDELIFGSDRDERKVWNVIRNSKGAVVIGGNPATDEAGYLIQGDLSVEADSEGMRQRRMSRRYEAESEGEGWAQGEKVIIRLRPRKVVRVW